MTASFSSLLLTSFKVIASLFLQYGIGASVAWVGVIKEQDMQALSALMNVILIPLMSCVSVGRGLSPAIFASDGWILSVLGFITLVEYASFAFLLRPMASPEPQFRRLFVLMMALGNVVAIPLSITQSLCELGAFEGELTTAECLLQSRALVFTYVTFNSFNIWVVAYGYVAGDTPEQQSLKAKAATAPADTGATLADKGATAADAAADAPAGTVAEAPACKSVIADEGGAAAAESGGVAAAETGGTKAAPAAESGDAAAPSVREAAPRRPPAPAPAPCAVQAAPAPSPGAAEASVASPSAPGTPARAVGEQSMGRRRRQWIAMARATGSRATLPPAAPPGAPRASPLAFARRQLASLLKRPPVLGLLAGLAIAMIEPVQAALFAPSAALEPIGVALATLSEGAVPVINLMLGFSLGHKLKQLASWRQLLGSKEAGISPRTMGVLTLGKMIALPVFHGAILYGLLRAGALPPSRLARVIAFIEAAPPTASIVVVLSHMARKPRAAQLVAWAIIPQYFVAMFSLTLVIAFALAVTEPEVDYATPPSAPPEL
eukprot:Transcript_10670.p2 GENE.Transcript_10670~~Transcript_10670.p2  ORF type:complete len:550 (-),score=217.43 Transcript_10670:89-1738(-)